MAQHPGHTIDSRYSTNTNVGRDQIIHYHALPLLGSGPSSQPPSSLSFNDAPIDLLSYHFTGRKEELDRIIQVFSTNHGSAATRCAIH
jgi:hypothetical protein